MNAQGLILMGMLIYYLGAEIRETLVSGRSAGFKTGEVIGSVIKYGAMITLLYFAAI